MKKSKFTFDDIYGVVAEWFCAVVGIEDCDNIVQTFAIGINEGKEIYDIYSVICEDYGFDFDEFEGVCADLEELIEG